MPGAAVCGCRSVPDGIVAGAGRGRGEGFAIGAGAAFGAAMRADPALRAGAFFDDRFIDFGAFVAFGAFAALRPFAFMDRFAGFREDLADFFEERFIALLPDLPFALFFVFFAMSHRFRLDVEVPIDKRRHCGTKKCRCYTRST
jgi:hypothetical protein